jgi:ABC-type phosphate/phosphonate transport system substrate-binding protein
MNRLLFSAALVVAIAPAAGRADDKEVYRIGVPKGLFRDVPQELKALAGQPFQDLMKEITGLDGEMVRHENAMAVAKAIDEGKLKFGVLRGFELAWVREKYPDLQPLVCSVDRPKEIQAVILVKHDCSAGHLGELKSAKIALATMLKDHARLFLERQRAERMNGDKFTGTEKTDTVHEAIQKVIDGEAELTVADHASWNYFQKLYPGASKNLKELARSEEFPPTVLVFKKGAIDDATLQNMRDGFLSAHKNRKAAQLMKLIKLERFDSIPDDFDAALKECLKVYPKPIQDD